MSAYDWISADRAEARRILGLWTACDVSHPRVKFHRPPFSGEGQPAAVFLAWKMGGYTEVTGGVLGMQSPPRMGSVLCSFFLEPDKGGSVIDDPSTGLMPQLLQHFEDREDDAGRLSDMTFLPPIPMSDQALDGWAVETVQFPFRV